ncbi:MAG: hypothetical protein IT539_07640 [Bradyrhizobiaceae bacterium]|nr:hypothetical protein [Bradyrhizobiaceae bacterium]
MRRKLRSMLEPRAALGAGRIAQARMPRKTADLEIPESELAEQRKPHVFGAQNERGWLGVYQRAVAPVHKEAVLTR